MSPSWSTSSPGSPAEAWGSNLPPGATWRAHQMLIFQPATVPQPGFWAQKKWSNLWKVTLETERCCYFSLVVFSRNSTPQILKVRWQHDKMMIYPPRRRAMSSYICKSSGRPRPILPQIHHQLNYSKSTFWLAESPPFVVPTTLGLKLGYPPGLWVGPQRRYHILTGHGRWDIPVGHLRNYRRVDIVVMSPTDIRLDPIQLPVLEVKIILFKPQRQNGSKRMNNFDILRGKII